MKGCPSHYKVLIIKTARHILRVCVFFVLFLELILGSFAPAFASELSEATVGEPVFAIGQFPKPFVGDHVITRRFGEKISQSPTGAEVLVGGQSEESKQNEATNSADFQEATPAVSINDEPASTRGELQTINQLKELEGEAGHNGLDFDMPEGTPVLAVDDGEVVSAGDGDYGITVVIKHSWGKSVYGHLSEVKVESGKSVARGQEIGLSGQTGLALGPHLHFGIKNANGEWVDPALHLALNDERKTTNADQVLGEATSAAALDFSHSASSVTFEDVSGDDSYLYNYKFNLVNGTSAYFGSKKDPRPGFAIADKNYDYKLRFFLQEESLNAQSLTTNAESDSANADQKEAVDSALVLSRLSFSDPIVDGNQVDFPIKVGGAIAILRYIVLNDRVKEEIVLAERPERLLGNWATGELSTSPNSLITQQPNNLKIDFEVRAEGLEVATNDERKTTNAGESLNAQSSTTNDAAALSISPSTLSKNNYVFKNTDGSTYWQIAEPTVKDASGKSGEIEGKLMVNSKSSMGIEQGSEQSANNEPLTMNYELTLASTFLEQASYPVVVDPTVVIANASAPLHLTVSKLGRFGWKLAIEYEIRDDADNILGSDVVITEVRPEETYMDIDILLRDYFTRRLAVWILGQGNYTLREMSFDRLSSAHFQRADNGDEIDDQYKEFRMARKQIIDSFSEENYPKYSLTFNEAELLQRPLYDEKDEQGNLTGKKLQGASTIVIENEKIGAGTEVLRPSGAGDLTQLTAFPATNNWSRVDESGVDDADYVYPGNIATWYSDRYALGDTALTTETISSIDITGRFSLDDGELYAIGRNVIRRSGSDTVGGTRTHNAGAFTTYTDSGVARPGGGSWVVADLNALQGGVDIDGDSDWINSAAASWFYVTVNFAASNQNPNAPSSLGGHVTGAFTADNTPTLTFSLSDPDGADTVKYQIQIDDSSDLLSPVVDYTSALAAQGNFSFTVGQAAGSGSYTTGSEGQTLSDASYYWQVKAIDNSAAASAYTQANSGAIAFKVDTTAPSAVSNLASSSHTASAWSADNTIDVSWTAATDTGGSGVAGYSYTFDTTSNTTPDTTQDGATTSTTSSAQSDGNSIYFHVRADDNVANWGTASHLGPFYVDTTAPSVPGTPSTTSPTTDSTPTWTFTASTDGGSGLHAATPYSVQWCTDSNFTGCDANTGTATTNSFTHATALADGTWYFKAKATDAVSNASSYSSNGSVVIDTTAPSAPTNVTSSLVLPKQVKISWDAVSGASLYYVYKSTTSSSSGFTVIGSPTTTSQHYDMSCTTHWFYVTALDSVSNESAASTVIEKNPDCSTSSGSSSTSSSSTSSTSTSTTSTTTASTTPVVSFQGPAVSETQEETSQEKTGEPQLSLPAEPPKTPLFNLPDVGGQLEKVLAGAGVIKTFVIAKLTDSVGYLFKQEKKLAQAFSEKTKPVLLAFVKTTSKVKGQFGKVKQTLASNLSNFFGWGKVKGAHTQYAYESKWLIVNSKWVEGLRFVTGDFRLNAFMLGSEAGKEIKPYGVRLAVYGLQLEQQMQRQAGLALGKIQDTKYKLQAARYKIQELGQGVISGAQLFWAAAIDKSPTKISNVAIAYVDAKTVIISWKTNHPTTSKVNYGLDTSYGMEVQDSRHIQNHKLTLTNLDEDRTYYFEVMGQGKDYVYDAYYTFTTKP